MQSKLGILLTSPAFWSIVAIFVLNGIQAVIPFLNGTGQTLANVALLALTAYTHAGTVQKAQGTR